MAQLDTASSVYENSKEVMKTAFNKVKNSAESPYFGQEDFSTRAIEHQTSKIPSTVFLGLALGAMAVAAGFAVTKERKGWANFFGSWAAPLLIMGLYNKIVKTHGSDAQHPARRIR